MVCLACPLKSVFTFCFCSLTFSHVLFLRQFQTLAYVCTEPRLWSMNTCWEAITTAIPSGAMFGFYCVSKSALKQFGLFKVSSTKLLKVTPCSGFLRPHLNNVASHVAAQIPEVHILVFFFLFNEKRNLSRNADLLISIPPLYLGYFSRGCQFPWRLARLIF